MNMLAKLALALAWAKMNWITTLVGFCTAGVVVLQRIPDNAIHPQDVIAGVVMAFLGALAVDPARMPAAAVRSGEPSTQVGPAARLAAWARANWRTTLAGLLSAAAVVLQRIPDNDIHPQDVAAALVLIVMGSLAVDPNRLPLRSVG